VVGAREKSREAENLESESGLVGGPLAVAVSIAGRERHAAEKNSLAGVGRNSVKFWKSSGENLGDLGEEIARENRVVAVVERRLRRVSEFCAELAETELAGRGQEISGGRAAEFVVVATEKSWPWKKICRAAENLVAGARGRRGRERISVSKIGENLAVAVGAWVEGVGGVAAEGRAVSEFFVVGLESAEFAAEVLGELGGDGEELGLAAGVGAEENAALKQGESRGENDSKKSDDEQDFDESEGWTRADFHRNVGKKNREFWENLGKIRNSGRRNRWPR